MIKLFRAVQYRPEQCVGVGRSGHLATHLRSLGFNSRHLHTLYLASPLGIVHGLPLSAL